MARSEGWYGCDFDGTLVDEDLKPISATVVWIKNLLEAGHEVRILTARAYAPPDSVSQQRKLAMSILGIQDFCQEHFGRFLPITCMKDHKMIEVRDDKSVRVEKNTGKVL